MKNGLIALIVAGLFLLPATQTALAHEGQPPAPHDLWNTWNWDPLIWASLLLSTWIYAGSQRELRQRTTSQRSALDWRAASYIAALITLFLALISPLDALSASLFSAHMTQHTLLIVVAPPLLILGISPGSFLLGLSAPVRKEFGRHWHSISWLKSVLHTLTQPWTAWGVNVFVLWAWHTPSLYQSALENEALHTLEHLTFVSTSLLFWWAIIRPGRSNLGVLSLFTMSLQCGLLGALITFAPIPWYETYAATTQPWGLAPLEDQQLAGAIMWVPVGAIYTLAALILFIIHLGRVERTAQQREDRLSPSLKDQHSR